MKVKVALQGGRFCTVEIDKGVLHRTIKPEHYLLKPRAIAFNEEVLDLAKEHNVRWVEVLDTETNVTYKTGLADFIAGSFLIERGYGVQYALPIGSWETSNPKKQAAKNPSGQQSIDNQQPLFSL